MICLQTIPLKHIIKSNCQLLLTLSKIPIKQSLYVQTQGLKTGQDTHAGDREESKLSPQFLSWKTVSTVILEYLHSSTCQPCYFETLSSATLHLVPLSVLNCSVLRKILQLAALMGWLAAVVRSRPPSCNPGCGVVVTVQSASLRAAEKSQAAASDPASNGVLQSRGQTLGWGGENFLVWQGLL